MGISKKETDLFEALRDAGQFDNFVLLEVKGRPVICIDHSEEQDCSEVEPIFGRLSDVEAARVIEQLEDEDSDEEEDQRRRPKQDRRWRG